MRYHPGKVVQIYSPTDKSIKSADDSEQVMLEMWDDNVVTVSVEEGLEGKLKKGAVVLVDYTPMAANSPVPKMTVTKVLKGEIAKKTWDRYVTFHKTRKGVSSVAPPTPKHAYG